MNFDSGKFKAYNTRFSVREFREVLSSTEATAPGEDTIVYEMLKCLPDDARKILLKNINKIWEAGSIPKDWKISIVPVKKLIEDACQPPVTDQ